MNIIAKDSIIAAYSQSYISGCIYSDITIKSTAADSSIDRLRICVFKINRICVINCATSHFECCTIFISTYSIVNIDSAPTVTGSFNIDNLQFRSIIYNSIAVFTIFDCYIINNNRALLCCTICSINIDTMFCRILTINCDVFESNICTFFNIDH